MGEPLVSIIMPCYNVKKFLEEAIVSVLEQTYKNYELIVIDNGSTDGSLDIIHRYEIEHEKIKIFKADKNRGVVGARNIGIRAAQGKYIAFLDSDDVWHSDKLSRQIGFMEENAINLSCTNYNIISEEGDDILDFILRVKEIDHKENLKYNHLGCSTVVYNQETLGKQYFFKKAKYKEDYGLWQKILKNGEKAHVCEKPLVKYRLRENSISADKVKMAREQWRFYKRVEGFGNVKTGYYFSAYTLKNIGKNLSIKFKNRFNGKG
ncbi:glycosyl transferase [Propionigenium maris DSM 9537]|uniref:Glycosyl transferase n=1 Tax=Propionigenium maris DSM 9537 TaxID=1123000 RepID=A0A9W6LND2_9FUSO|nr:glycosyltransferase family 2 protein [Propionigenium maris]GLI56779.1 glycosyl transferase [Propionigenium maris DSM 9537]